MSLLWDGLKGAAGRAGNAAGLAAQRAKVKTELLIIDREIAGRRQAFGVELYDYAAPRLAASPQVLYASDDVLVATMRPAFITAQREIAALEIKEGKLKELMSEAAVHRGNAITPAYTWQQKLANAGKSTALAGNEAKLGTELRMIRTQINHHKQLFGVSLYATLEEMEDTSQWLPTDREIRSIYDSCRRDVDKMKQRRTEKQKELTILEGTSFWAAKTDKAEPYVAPHTQPAAAAIPANSANPANQSSLGGLGGLGAANGSVGIVTSSSLPSLNNQPFPSALPPQQPQQQQQAPHMMGVSAPGTQVPPTSGYNHSHTMAVPVTHPQQPQQTVHPSSSVSLDPTGFMDHHRTMTSQPSHDLLGGAGTYSSAPHAQPQPHQPSLVSNAHDPFAMLSVAPSPALPLSDVTNGNSAGSTLMGQASSASPFLSSSSNAHHEQPQQQQPQASPLSSFSPNGLKKEVGMYMLKNMVANNKPSVWGQ